MGNMIKQNVKRIMDSISRTRRIQCVHFQTTLGKQFGYQRGESKVFKHSAAFCGRTSQKRDGNVGVTVLVRREDIGPGICPQSPSWLFRVHKSPVEEMIGVGVMNEQFNHMIRRFEPVGIVPE